MRFLAQVSLVLVIVLVSLSAYLRLAHSGLGCAEWPSCYGRIGEPVAAAAAGQTAYDKIIDEANAPMAWATPLHRLVASLLGLAVLFMTLTAFLSKRGPNRRLGIRLVTAALLGLTIYLAMLGLQSGTLVNPAVIMGNLLGGFAMLGLLGWLVFQFSAEPVPDGRLRWLTMAAIGVLALQIVLGGLTSANFSATACSSLPDCNGSWMPGPNLSTAFDLSREHQVNDYGIAIGGEERTDIHKAHRLGAVVALLTMLAVGITALRSDRRYRGIGSALLVLVAAEFAIGIIAVLTALPIGIAVAHNWLAGLLLLALVLLYVRAGSPASAT